MDEWRKGTSAKVSLKEMRWPSFSVSTSTPSQSKRRADGRAEQTENLTPLCLAPLLITGLVVVVVVVVVIALLVIPGLVPKREEEKVLWWLWRVVTEAFLWESKAFVDAEEEEMTVEAIVESLSLPRKNSPSQHDNIFNGPVSPLIRHSATKGVLCASCAL